MAKDTVLLNPDGSFVVDADGDVSLADANETEDCDCCGEQPPDPGPPVDPATCCTTPLNSWVLNQRCPAPAAAAGTAIAVGCSMSLALTYTASDSTFRNLISNGLIVRYNGLSPSFCYGLVIVTTGTGRNSSGGTFAFDFSAFRSRSSTNTSPMNIRVTPPGLSTNYLQINWDQSANVTLFQYLSINLYTVPSSAGQNPSNAYRPTGTIVSHTTGCQTTATLSKNDTVFAFLDNNPSSMNISLSLTWQYSFCSSALNAFA